MAIDAKIRVVMVGGAQALKTVQGVSRETKKAGTEAKKIELDRARAAKQSAAEQLKVARQAAAEGVAIEKRKLKEIEKQHRMAAQAIGKWAQSITQQAKQEAAKQVKIAEQSAKTQAKAAAVARRDRGRKGAWLIGGATAGVLAGGASAMGTARGVAGVEDVRTRIQKANDFRERLIITSKQAGVSGEGREQIQSKVMDAAVQSGKDPAEVMAALELGQKQFNGLEKFAAIIGDIAVTAKASGSDIQDLTGALGYAQQAFGFTDAEMEKAMNMMVAASAKGSIELADFARDFAPVMGLFAEGTGQKGLEGLAQLLGTAQAVGTLGAGSSQSATMVERFTADLSDKDVKRKLKRAGVDTKGKSTQQIVEQLATKNFSAEKLQGIFPETKSREAVTALVSARNRVASGKDPNAVDLASIASIDPSEGSSLTQSTMKDMEDSGLLALQRQAVTMQNDTIANLKAYNDQVLAVTEVSNKLEKSLGTLSLWSDSIASGGIGGGGTALLGTLATSGGTAAAAGAGGAAAGGFMASGALAVGAGVLAAGLAGYGLGTAIDKWTGLSDKIANALTPGINDARDRLNENAVMPGKGSSSPAVDPKAPWTVATDPQLLAEIRMQTRELKRQTEELVKRGPLALNNGARGGK